MEGGEELISEELNQPINLPEILCWCNTFVQLIRGFMFVLKVPWARHPRQMAPEQAPNAAGNSGWRQDCRGSISNGLVK